MSQSTQNPESCQRETTIVDVAATVWTAVVTVGEAPQYDQDIRLRIFPAGSHGWPEQSDDHRIGRLPIDFVLELDGNWCYVSDA